MIETTNGAQHQHRVFGLCRASDTKQVESVSTQRQLIQAACKSMNLPEPTILEEPPGTSGYKTRFAKRPMGMWCLRNLRKGDILIALRIDRVGRSMSDCYSTIEMFFNRGVRIIILKGWSGQVIDLRDPTSRLLLAILAWVAEEEARKIAERTKEGLAYRRNNGLSDGKRMFTYIQAYNAAGEEIPRGEYNKLAGHHLRNLPDRQWLNQLCELLLFQKATRAKGRVLVDYCREKQFVNRAGKQWWNGKIYANAMGFYSNVIPDAMKKVRRLAVLGKLPEDYNQRVLAITRDTPADVGAKFRYKVKRGNSAKQTVELNISDIDSWDENQLREWIRQSQPNSFENNFA